MARTNTRKQAQHSHAHTHTHFPELSVVEVVAPGVSAGGATAGLIVVWV